MGLSWQVHHTLWHCPPQSQETMAERPRRHFVFHFGTLLSAVSTAITTMILRLLPQAPSQLSIPQLWQHFHHYLNRAPSRITLHTINDDLVGFLNSVPQDRLLDAVKSVTTKCNLTYDTSTHHRHFFATGNTIQLSHIGQHHRRHRHRRTTSASKP